MNHTTVKFSLRVHSQRMMVVNMSDVTEILDQIESGDRSAAAELLPLIYEELRKLAAARMARESADHTLQPTALVHEAYVRLVDGEVAQRWNSRGHFFGAAAEAMRRILVESARQKQQLKHGGGLRRLELDQISPATKESPEHLVLLNDALDRLGESDPLAARVFQLRYFAGLSVEQAAHCLHISRATAYRNWNFARAWLQTQV